MRKVMNMDERMTLTNNVRMYKFALTEAILYLDAYPCNEKALEYYIKTRDLARIAEEEYERAVGPLHSANAVCEGGKYLWTEGPWPWEMEANR